MPGSGKPGFIKKTPLAITLQAQRRQAQNQLNESLQQLRQAALQKIEAERSSDVIVYYSRNLLDENEVVHLYHCLSGVTKLDHIDLVVVSPGGLANCAYKIGRQLREHCNKLAVLVPYKAKSAATLLTLAGDEILMGPASELGPLDPQIQIITNNQIRIVPALAIKDGLDFFETRVKSSPDLVRLYQGVVDELDAMVIGSYVREIGLSKQYATEFLTTYSLKSQKKKAKDIANNLVEGFMSHGYVIDRQLATKLGLKVIHADGSLWDSMWELHSYCDNLLNTDKNVGTVIMVRGSEIIIPTNRERYGM